MTMPPASFVEELASATSIFDRSIIVGSPPNPELDQYKVQVARAFREMADYWERAAARQRRDQDSAAIYLAYRNAYNDAANLIESGEVAW